MIQNSQRRALAFLLCASTMLVIIGCIFIYSSSSIFALEHYGYAHYFVYRQFFGIGIGILALLIAACLPISIIHVLTPLCYALSLIIMTIPFILPNYARIIHGSARWMVFMGQSFQPVEFVRIFFILMMAYSMNTEDFAYTRFWRCITKLILIIAPLIALLLLQPDFGQAFLFTSTALCMFFVARKDLKNIWPLLAGAAGMTSLLIVMKPYRLRRLLTFLYPWNDPQGAGFQIIQSLIAIGSGGLAGIGIGQSRQKFFYLPMQHTDFIFSIIAEETGLWGPIFIMLLYGTILYCGIYLAWHTRDSFCQLTLFGYTLIISLQAIINLAVTTGLAPTKGIGLPFISYGMSSLIAHGCILGVIISCTRSQATSNS